jgi:hypothetical protein
MVKLSAGAAAWPKEAQAINGAKKYAAISRSLLPSMRDSFLGRNLDEAGYHPDCFQSMKASDARLALRLSLKLIREAGLLDLVDQTQIPVVFFG